MHYTTKRLEEERLENKRVKNDNDDLQHEFERERQEYLNTIREQEKRLMLFRAMLSKMVPLIPRSCNYSNAERIMDQARYDDEKSLYVLPDVTKDEVQFPQVGNTLVTNNGRTPGADVNNLSRAALPTSTTANYEDDFDAPAAMNGHYSNPAPSAVNMDDLERRYNRNSELSTIPPQKTRIKRQEQLLNESSLLQRGKRPLQMNNVDTDYMNRRLNPFEAPARIGRKYGFSTDKH